MDKSIQSRINLGYQQQIIFVREPAYFEKLSFIILFFFLQQSQ